jgi:hypothetical protein
MADGQPQREWLTRHRTTIYVVMNVFVLLAALVGSAVHDIDIGRAVYAEVLFALCSLPLLSLSSLNGRFFMLAVFMALYFLFFGALDLQALLIGEEIHPIHDGFLDPAELAILSGCVMVLVGYFAGGRLVNTARDSQELREWPPQIIVLAGITMWVVGTAAIIYFQVFTVPEKTNSSAAHGFAAMGPFLTFVVMLGHLVEPLGVFILAYGYARFRSIGWTVLILTVVFTHVVVGFITDIKLQALMAGAIVILVKTLVDNRLPRAWIAGGVAFIIIAFPIFQAYRVEVTGERGLNRLQALRELPKVLEIAFSSRDKVANGSVGEGRSQTFVERSSSKQNIELLMQHVGSDVPYLNGRSLVAIPMAFVPRLLVPEKEDLSVGQLFTRQVLKSDTDTYISISHLGELYWNFGWTGVLVGMLFTGTLLGFIGAKCSLERGVSITRLLVLVASVQPLCLGFGGQMPISYVIWLRSVAAVGLLNLVFARRVARPAQAENENSDASSKQRSLPATVAPVPRFSNMMR